MDVGGGSKVTQRDFKQLERRPDLGDGTKYTVLDTPLPKDRVQFCPYTIRPMCPGPLNDDNRTQKQSNLRAD